MRRPRALRESRGQCISVSGASPSRGGRYARCSCAHVVGTSAPPSSAIRGPKRTSAGCEAIFPVTSDSPSRTRTADGVHVVFDRSIDIAALARLVAAEQTCCAFYTFAIVVAPEAITLDVRAPAGAEAMVEGLFGPVSA